MSRIEKFGRRRTPSAKPSPKDSEPGRTRWQSPVQAEDSVIDPTFPNRKDKDVESDPFRPLPSSGMQESAAAAEVIPPRNVKHPSTRPRLYKLLMNLLMLLFIALAFCLFFWGRSLFSEPATAKDAAERLWEGAVI